MTVQIQEPQKDTGLPLLAMGFRPFFLFAGLFAIVSMLLWTGVYHQFITLPLNRLLPMQWHAHEMIYGYGVAVIAGFLLTSVKNWTGLVTAQGKPLGLMTLLWVASRVVMGFGDDLLVSGVILNVVFLLSLTYVIAGRIIKVSQWRQAGIVAVVLLLTVGEFLFLMGLVTFNYELISQAIYLGFYLVLLMILVMGRRVIPFFIERGVGYPVSLKHSQLMDFTVIAAFVVYAVNDLLARNIQWSITSGAILFLCHIWRLKNWYTFGIWKKPLLWSLYLTQAFFAFGFLLVLLVKWYPLSPYIVIHAFAVGVIGVITLSMMSRVSLGHTGRDVHNPPAIIKIALSLMIMAAITRVLLPIFSPDYYGVWVGVSQVAWIAAFSVFVGLYWKMLVRPRADGKTG